MLSIDGLGIAHLKKTAAGIGEYTYGTDEEIDEVDGLEFLFAVG